MGDLFSRAETDDAKLIGALVRSGLAHSARDVAKMAGVDEGYAKDALARMADENPPYPIPQDWLDYPVVRRQDLGSDVYEAVETYADD